MRQDPLLTVVDMDMMLIFWKNIFMWVTVPIFAAVPCSISSSGVIENNLDAIYEVMNSPALIALVLLAMINFTVYTFLSLYVINKGNTMIKVMVSMYKTFTVWIFFMIWPNVGHEDFGWLKFIGISLINIGTYFFIVVETETAETEEPLSDSLELSFALTTS